MGLSVTDDQEISASLRLLQDSAADFARHELKLDRVRALRGKTPCFDRSLWRRMAEMGWTGLLVPENLGGAGLNYGHMACVVDVLGEALIPEPFVATSVLAAEALLLGEGKLRDDLLESVIFGSRVIAFAHQEVSGVAAGPMLTVIGRENDALKLNGRKRYVYPGSGADGYIVSFREGDGAGLCWMPADFPGLEIHDDPRADGTACASLAFNRMVIPENFIISRPCAGNHQRMASVFDRGVIMTCVELVSVMRRALEITLDYLRLRKQFGKPIGSFQALQHRAVDLYIQKELSVSAAAAAVTALDRNAGPAEIAALASRAKSRCSDAARVITREAIQLHGAIGFSDECDIGLYLQRALVLSAWLGNAADHRRRYASLSPAEAGLPSGDSPVSREKFPSSGTRHPESSALRNWDEMGDDEFRNEIRQYFEAHYPGELRYLLRRARWAETRDWYYEMSRKGWIAPHWPREYGGMGLSPSKLLIYLEEQERWGVARAPDQGIVMLGPLLMKWGTEEQKKCYLPPILSGEHIWSQGYSEPDSGSDLASLRTEAVQDGDHFVINGQKIWCTLAQDANHMFLLARTDRTALKQKGISFFLLELSTPGVTIRPIRNIEGHEEFCEVRFENVRVHRDNMVGGLNEGWTVAKALLGFERLNHGSPKRLQYPLKRLEIVARSLGLMDDGEFLSKYTKLKLDVDDLASTYSRFADVFRSGKPLGAEASMLKIWATETFCRLVDLLIETAGDSGGLRGEIDVGGHDVDILSPFYIGFVATIAAGSNEIQRNILAKRVLGLT